MRSKKTRHTAAARRSRNARQAYSASYRPVAHMRIAVLIESSRSYGRGLLLGVAQYARERANWRMDYQERELQSGLPGWLNHWKGDGVLVRLEDDFMARKIFELNVPVVDLRRIGRSAGIPSVHTDEPKVAQLVFEHFRERGFANFAFCGYPGLDYSDARAKALTEQLAKHGHACSIYNPPAAMEHRYTIEFEQEGFEFEDHLAKWLESLPKPVGVMTCNDIRGQQVLNVCRRVGISVPEQVAVIGVDNDEILCGLSDPPLSSVAPDTRRIGYEAAALLDRLMQGQKAEAKDFYCDPLGVVTRRSTDTLVIPHAGAARVLSFLRRHYREQITLKDAASEAGMTIRAVQDVFKKHVGRSLRAELERLRIDHARILMRDSELKIEAVAAACGFSNCRHFRRAFVRQTGSIPSSYR